MQCTHSAENELLIRAAVFILSIPAKRSQIMCAFENASKANTQFDAILEHIRKHLNGMTPLSKAEMPCQCQLPAMVRVDKHGMYGSR